MKKRKGGAAAYLSVLLYSVLIGFSSLIVKQSVSSATALQTLFFRFGFALVFVLILTAVRVVRPSFKGKGKKLPLLLLSVFYVGSLGLQAWALTYTTSIMSGILFAVVPVIAAVFSALLLKEKTNAAQNCFMALSAASVIAMTLLGSSFSAGFSLPGILILIASVVCSALASVFMRMVKSDFSPYEIGFVNSLVGVIGFGIAACILNGFSVQAWADFASPVLNLDFIFYMLYLGVGCTFITSVLQGYGLKHLPTVQVTVWGNLSAVISMLAGALILREAIEVYQIICSVLIITGVLGVNLCAGRRRRS